jgi:uncharacterized protein with NAD-binding domain and iron-sulfur cluster
MPDMDRRTFLAGTAAAATTAAVATTRAGAVVKKVSVGAAGAADPRFAGARHAAVLGGGCGGLSAAHELIERGFTVDIYERYPVAGGKCRSIPSTGTGSGGRADLPGEHGFRFFPGYYRHVIDTMARIPYGSNRNGVKDNLTFGETARFSRKDALDVPFPYKKLLTINPITDLPQALIGLLGVIPGLQLNELLYFATRLTEFVTSCDARRDNQYDKLSWWDFVQAERFSPLYQNLLTRSLTRNLVAAQAEQASTRTIGLQATRILVGNILFSMYDEASRLLNAPTTEAWIDPWLTYLKGKGVRWFPDTAVEGLELSDGTVSGVRVRGGGQATTVTADVYVLAIPVEGARHLLGAPFRALDPGLTALDGLFPDWMTGVQFFLSRSLPIAKGHVTYVDSPWALTSISQGQFWNRDLSTYGNGTVRDVVSVDVSNWGAPGVLFGKTARDCTRDEIFAEVWQQMKESLNEDGIILRDSDVVDRFLDPAIEFGPDGTPVDNAEPLLINTVDSWAKRPDAVTKIPNLVLASDYVKTNTDLATMEGANEAARRAVNGVLDVTGWSGARARIWTIPEPPLFAFARAEDGFRYALGLPHKLSDRR